MAVPPSINHSKGGGNKDYPLWYDVGQRVVHGFPLYETDASKPFSFMYPPFAGICLGGLSLLGSTGMLIVLILLNVVSLAVAVELSVRLVAGTGNVSLGLRIIPTAVCIFFVNDMFLLGQPNLGLLCLVLGGLMRARSGHEWTGGVLFALAAAIKAFPAVVIVYLVWRRYWRAAASMMIWTTVFLVLAPAPVRGFERNWTELKTWANGMLFRQDASGHGQRPEQSVGWGNQSLFGLGNRLFRPGNVLARETLDRGAEPVYVNFVDLDFRGAQLATLALAGLLGLGFVLVMPKRTNRTRDTDAAEFGILIVLMIIGTPYAFSYYFVWLIYPLTVVLHHGLGHTGKLTERNVAWDVVITVLVLFAASIPGGGNIYPMAFGSLFWAAIAAAAGCVWALRRAGSP
jgi:hypothetical protein